MTIHNNIKQKHKLHVQNSKFSTQKQRKYQLSSHSQISVQQKPLQAYLSEGLIAAVRVLADNIMGRLFHHLLYETQQVLLVHARRRMHVCVNLQYSQISQNEAQLL